jgi:hypothetical protein
MAGVFIQWKGSDVCLDFTCRRCGFGGHLDADFAYAVRCPSCRRVFLLPDTFELTEDDGAYEASGAIVQDVEMEGHVADGDHAPYGPRRIDPTGVIGEPG